MVFEEVCKEYKIAQVAPSQVTLLMGVECRQSDVLVEVEVGEMILFPFQARRTDRLMVLVGGLAFEGLVV